MVKLHLGDAAPKISAESVNKGKLELGDYLGSNVLLVFGRYFGCPVCQVDFESLVEIAETYPEVKVVYFTQSSPENVREYLGDRDVGFPVVTVLNENGKYKVYHDFGVGNFGLGTGIKLLRRAQEAKKAGVLHGDYEGRETQSPADFVLDEEGKIIRAHVGVFEVDALKAFLSNL
ncbi:MAG: redoxin domain-containing protein [Candidatus Bathyarchaeota archaeon]|nr:redoxin domain-containing protein [Candidatus Bathyarchaeota archaeon]